VLMWKKGEEFLAVGKSLITKDSRFSLESALNGNALLIKDAEEGDAGNYTCQISTYQPVNLHHRLKIRGERDAIF